MDEIVHKVGVRSKPLRGWESPRVERSGTWDVPYLWTHLDDVAQEGRDPGWVSLESKGFEALEE